jgi:hypothetical protein
MNDTINQIIGAAYAAIGSTPRAPYLLIIGFRGIREEKIIRFASQAEAVDFRDALFATAKDKVTFALVERAID